MRRIILQSPSKLNLLLKVMSKRADGYHNLETIFERIDLADDIELSLNRDGIIRVFCDDPGVPTDSNNLVYKAAFLLKEEFALNEGVDIRIHKRIPVAAGLAGGSSNAATTLLGLNQLWKLDLSQRELINYAQKIGSDVPFFVHDCSWALGIGRGDQIKRLAIKTKLWHILVVPPIAMYSKKVFEALILKLTKPDDDVNILTRSLRWSDIDAISSSLRNDLETTIVKLCPNLLKVKEELRALNIKGLAFSGSGPCLFGLTRTQQEAENLRVVLKKQYTQVFVVRTL